MKSFKFLRNFILFILLIPIACTQSIEFEQKVEFFIEATDQLYTNISVFITENDVKGFLKEDGYSGEDFRSMEIESAVVSTIKTVTGLNWISELTLSVSNDTQGYKKLYEDTELNRFSSGSFYTSLDIKIEEDYYLNAYKNTPFYLNCYLSGSNSVEGPITLSIKGTITVYP